MLKNNIIELFDINTKAILYDALEQNKNIMYTINERSVPQRTKAGIENIYVTKAYNRNYVIAIEPDKMQLEYFDYNISTIEKMIDSDLIQDLKKFSKGNSKEKFIRALEHSNFNFLSQYESETVYNYILLLA